MNIVAQCERCRRGYVMVCDEKQVCCDHTCGGRVIILEEPVPRKKWNEPNKLQRKVNKKFHTNLTETIET